MAQLRNAIYNVLLREKNVCCLCFEAAETNAIRIDDEVFINENEVSNNVELSEVLAFICGSEVGDLASETVCKQCASTALYCYIFIQKCQENFRNLHRAIESLDNCLQIATAPERIQFCKSLFVSLDASYAAREYYDYKPPGTKPSVILKRFQSISSKTHTHYYLKGIKNNDGFDADIEVPIVEQEATKIKCKKETTTTQRTAPIPRDLILHKDSKPLAYKCKSCLKNYKDLIVLKEHYMRVHAPKTYKCSKCESVYGSYSFLETHFKNAHAPCVCGECGKSYNNKYSLNRHELGHRLRFVCQKCGRVYKNKNSFRDHKESGVCEQTSRKSTKLGLFQCDYCNKKYSRKMSLISHIKEHSDKAQPFVCHWCGKKFRFLSRLNDHIPKHTQEKNFSCETCGGRFVTKSSLLYHTRIHTGEKPYECSACGKRFLNSSRRAEHFRRFHTDDTFNCDLCDAKFRDRCSLKEHKIRHSISNTQSKLVKRKKNC